MEALRARFIVSVGVSDARRALGRYHTHAVTRLPRARRTKEALSSFFRVKLYAYFLVARYACFCSPLHDAHDLNQR